MEKRSLITFCLDTNDALRKISCKSMAQLSEKSRIAVALEYLRRQLLIRDTVERILDNVADQRVIAIIQDIYRLELDAADERTADYLDYLDDVVGNPTPDQQATAIVLAETRNEVEARFHSFTHPAFRISPLKPLLYRDTPWVSSIPIDERRAMFQEIMRDVKETSWEQ